MSGGLVLGVDVAGVVLPLIGCLWSVSRGVPSVQDRDNPMGDLGDVCRKGRDVHCMRAPWRELIP